MAKKQKNPFGRYTFKQIQSAEAESYMIQVGKALFDVDGRELFDKKACVIYYNQILEELTNVIEGGDEDEKADAITMLGGLRVHSLRIH